MSDSIKIKKNQIDGLYSCVGKSSVNEDMTISVDRNGIVYINQDKGKFKIENSGQAYRSSEAWTAIS